MKVKKGDQVLITSGDDRLKKGKILKLFPKEKKVLVEGVNISKKHVRPKRSGEKGQIVQMPKPISISNVKLICSKCGKAVKAGYKLTKDGKKYRICKKCGQGI